MIREDFLQQSAYSDTDSFCPMEKQYLMLKVIMTYYTQMNDAMNRGVTLKQIQGLPIRTGIGRMKDIGNTDDLKKMIGEISTGLTALEVEK